MAELPTSWGIPCLFPLSQLCVGIPTKVPGQALGLFPCPLLLRPPHHSHHGHGRMQEGWWFLPPTKDYGQAPQAGLGYAQNLGAQCVGLFYSSFCLNPEGALIITAITTRVRKTNTVITL